MKNTLFDFDCPGQGGEFPEICGPGLQCIEKKCKICDERFNFIFPDSDDDSCNSSPRDFNLTIKCLEKFLR